jgi:hypothetical protein
VIVAGSASRLSMSWIWAMAWPSATPGASLNEIVIPGSMTAPRRQRIWCGRREAGLVWVALQQTEIDDQQSLGYRILCAASVTT